MDVGHSNGWRLDDVVTADEIVATLDAAFPLEPLPPVPLRRVSARRKRLLEVSDRVAKRQVHRTVAEGQVDLEGREDVVGEHPEELLGNPAVAKMSPHRVQHRSYLADEEQPEASLDAFLISAIEGSFNRRVVHCPVASIQRPNQLLQRRRWEGALVGRFQQKARIGLSAPSPSDRSPVDPPGQLEMLVRPLDQLLDQPEVAGDLRFADLHVREVEEMGRGRTLSPPPRSQGLLQPRDPVALDDVMDVVAPDVKDAGNLNRVSFFDRRAVP